ncbi:MULTISPECIES: 4-alpha-glucanotransferase [unclassified Candidatus Frackibacter]|uniref:4-alpha-glucanotransferase n=1 Tax=unclassified Candidatus Frackibacter TaxID=2648818 RepID=UPI000887E54F|nr:MULTISPECIES: 4-alpha-glucanotransferase [unclassified Candidatus Frackibacter]SDC34055.1 4-alpha-glucanotransferase [Candidatus Frackibacter sp. WG11]SEM57160.1 4-alpha-glucanotransferase [Candidatus Frackibacter sp. WG12]SFL70116.1 4-alpha-glucanotransferase [Candidatus Frackibacter sp. WG13]
MEFKRESGILLHPTSLPGKYGIGSLGEEAYDFIDFLILSEQKLWQIFPLGPTGYGDSPYQSFSAFAGNPLLISLDKLKESRLLSEDDLSKEANFVEGKVDYGQVIDFKMPLLEEAFYNFKETASQLEKNKFFRFCQEQGEWLENYATFMALKEHFKGKPWFEWEESIKLREADALKKYKEELQERINLQKFMQYLFFKQWRELKAYANQNGIKIVGDVPIFVAYDSAGVWANPDIFKLNKDREPVSVAGVPPDYFSKTGQLWGNPLYNWDRLKEEGYRWWIARLEATLELVDIIRLDHFRGFAAYWAVPYGEKTAVNGEWKAGPGKDFFNKVKEELGELPIIAEDLGVITDKVEDLRDHFGLPGMQVLQFGFNSKEDSEHLPHNYSKNSVVYTGTHDNDTTLGWYQKKEAKIKDYIREYLNGNDENICWDLIRLAWSSVAVFAIAPLQDILGLGSEARMNTPGEAAGNWQWRYTKEMLNKDKVDRLKRLTKIYYR